MKTISLGLLGALLPWAAAAAQDTAPYASRPSVLRMGGASSTSMQNVLPQPAPVAPPSPAAPSAPTITLYERHGHVTPVRQGFTHTGAGNIDVAQPTPDTVIVTMTGVAVAGGHPTQDSVATLDFMLEQCLDIAAGDPRTAHLKVVMEARVIGLLRSHPGCGQCKPGKGSAEMSVAHAALTACGGGDAIAVTLEPHGVAGGENLSLNDHSGPMEGPIVPGKYILHQKFTITATHPRSVLPCKAASAEFAPDPALDPLWISYREPFHGAIKKDFGFQVVLKVVPDTTPN